MNTITSVAPVITADNDALRRDFPLKPFAIRHKLAGHPLLMTPMDPLTEALLVFAARRDHLQQVIEPALAQGQMVLCDRFTDASFAYQGGGRGFDATVLAQLEIWVQEGRQPDLTLWFDLPAHTAATRRAAARTPDRFEAQDEAFFQRVSQAYAARCQANPQRFVRLDAAADRGTVWRAIEAALHGRRWS